MDASPTRPGVAPRRVNPFAEREEPTFYPGASTPRHNVLRSGTSVLVIPIADLIRNKQANDRPQDLAVVAVSRKALAQREG